MQARYVMDIGMILEDDAHYADGKGRGYYIDYVTQPIRHPPIGA